MSAQRPWTRYVRAATEPEARAAPGEPVTVGDDPGRKPGVKRAARWRLPGAVVGRGSDWGSD